MIYRCLQIAILMLFAVSAGRGIPPSVQVEAQKVSVQGKGEEGREP